MNKKRMTEVLAAHADGLVGRPEAIRRLNPTIGERNRLTPLFQLAEQLQQSMRPVQPSAVFVRSLGKELVDNARHRIVFTKRLRRTVMIGAAALGSLISVASAVGAILFVVARLRARAQARALHAPAG
ncbi:MAG: hypothetical protein SWK90_20505 [Chloroflexota bacterium]|nr:hypothetical protein [Chloroflexota bacterium]